MGGDEEYVSKRKTISFSVMYLCQICFDQRIAVSSFKSGSNFVCGDRANVGRAERCWSSLKIVSRVSILLVLDNWHAVSWSCNWSFDGGTVERLRHRSRCCVNWFGWRAILCCRCCVDWLGWSAIMCCRCFVVFVVMVSLAFSQTFQ